MIPAPHVHAAIARYMLARLRREPGVGLAPVGSVVAATDPTRPDLDFVNRVYGQPSVTDIPALVAHYRDHGIAGWLELDDRDAELAGALSAVAARVGEHELFAGPATAGARDARTVETRDGERFARTFLAGVEASGASTAGLAALAADPAARLLLAVRDDQAVACASLYLVGAVGLLADASTAPAARRAGLQAALIAHRTAIAAEAGARAVAAGATPGSTSARNLARAGLGRVGLLGCWRLREPARAQH